MEEERADHRGRDGHWDEPGAAGRSDRVDVKRRHRDEDPDLASRDHADPDPPGPGTVEVPRLPSESRELAGGRKEGPRGCERPGREPVARGDREPDRDEEENAHEREEAPYSAPRASRLVKVVGKTEGRPPSAWSRDPGPPRRRDPHPFYRPRTFRGAVPGAGGDGSNGRLPTIARRPRAGRGNGRERAERGRRRVAALSASRCPGALDRVLHGQLSPHARRGRPGHRHARPRAPSARPCGHRVHRAESGSGPGRGRAERGTDPTVHGRGGSPLPPVPHRPHLRRGPRSSAPVRRGPHSHPRVRRARGLARGPAGGPAHGRDLPYQPDRPPPGRGGFSSLESVLPRVGPLQHRPLSTLRHRDRPHRRRPGPARGTVGAPAPGAAPSRPERGRCRAVPARRARTGLATAARGRARGRSRDVPRPAHPGQGGGPVPGRAPSARPPPRMDGGDRGRGAARRGGPKDAPGRHGPGGARAVSRVGAGGGETGPAGDLLGVRAPFTLRHFLHRAARSDGLGSGRRGDDARWPGGDRRAVRDRPRGRPARPGRDRGRDRPMARRTRAGPPGSDHREKLGRRTRVGRPHGRCLRRLLPRRALAEGPPAP